MTLRPAAWALGVAACLGACLGAGLAGCSSPAPRATQPATAPPPAPQPLRPAAGLDDFGARYGLAAEAATREGRWSDAVFSLDVLRALRPDDANLLRLRDQARQSAATAAAARLAQAHAARQRGEAEAASKLYLEVLALAPDHTEAANHLRSLERERNRRVQRNRAARSAAAQRGTVAAAPGSAAATVAAGPAAVWRSPSGHNEIEHASLLAAQGELDGAIAVLAPMASTHRADPAARTLLADLLFRRAELLQAADPEGAIEALQRSLQVDPRHDRAARLLRALGVPSKDERSPPKRPGRSEATR